MAGAKIGSMSTRPDCVDTQLTLVLLAAHRGDREAAQQAYARLYPELSRIARARLRELAPGTLLETQDLVHEGFLRLMQQGELRIDDRRHFFAYAAKAMRHIVIDFARRRQAQRRGGDLHRVTLATEALERPSEADEVIEVDAALSALERLDPRLARLVEMRFFGGYDDAAIAEALDISDRTVRRLWIKARAFLLVQLQA